MDPVLGNIWAAALTLILIKIIADLYSSYAKWVQALRAKTQRQMPCELEALVVAGLDRWKGLALPIVFLLVLVIALLLTESARFPFLTLISLASTTAVSILGALGDRSRLQAS